MIKDFVPPHPEHEYTLHLGYLLLEWNNLESTRGRVLREMTGLPPLVFDMLSAPMGAVSLGHLISGFLNFFPEQIRPYVDHFLEGFDILRGYRNFYVHCIKNVTLTADGEPVGIAHEIRFDGNLKVLAEERGLDEIQSAITSIIQFRAFGLAIAAQFVGGMPAAERLSQILNKPAMPEKLARNPEVILRKGQPNP